MSADGRADLTLTGRAWVFGDGVNTDDMFPGFAMRLPVDEAAQYMFDASRPGWPRLVQPGDIVVAGRNFGIGSSRPVPLLFRALGVAAVVADRFNSLFFRNCINYGLPALTVPDATAVVTEGDRLTVDLARGHLANITTGASRTVPGLPDFLVDVVRSGGLFPQLEASGHLRATPHP